MDIQGIETGFGSLLIMPAVGGVVNRHVHRVTVSGHAEINAGENAAAADLGMPDQLSVRGVQRVDDAGFCAGQYVLPAVARRCEDGSGAEVIVWPVFGGAPIGAGQ